MKDSHESSTGKTPPPRSWLMLISAVPSKPDYLRVKLRRRVQRLGAVGLKGAVYLLPQTAEATKRFQQLRSEIVADGGDATVCSATLITGMTDAELIARFNHDRDAEYGAFVVACDALAARWSADHATRPNPEAATLLADRGRLFARLEELLGRDFFAAPRREDAMQAIERLAVLEIAHVPGGTAGE